MTAEPTGPPTDEPRLHDITGSPLAVVPGRVALPDLPSFFDSAFTRLAAVLTAQRVAATGPALCRYGAIDDRTMELEPGLPVERAIEPDGVVVAAQLPSGRVARSVHHGAFDGLDSSWDRLHAWITAQGLVPGAIRWEVYLTEPNPHMDPADLRTELNWTIADRGSSH